MIRVSVLGATGYAGAELLRLLSAHPDVEIVSAASRSFAGEALEKVYSNFLASKKISLVNPEELSGQEQDLIFLALPHGESMKEVPKVLDAGVKAIDLSADFRYANTGTYEEWYSRLHTAKDENTKAVYGLPEFNASRIQDAFLVANPGCYPTAAILALVPLLKASLIKSEGIVINAASGVSGAGRKESADYSFCQVDENYKVYAPVRHQHTSEIEEQAFGLADKEISPILFTPHLLPVKRGILLTIYADLADDATADKIQQAYTDAYKDAAFTSVVPVGVMPELHTVVGSNNCMIGFAISERTGKIVICSAIDNLLKGAAGQAVQNMNIMFGLAQDTGLSHIAWYL